MARRSMTGNDVPAEVVHAAHIERSVGHLGEVPGLADFLHLENIDTVVLARQA